MSTQAGGGAPGLILLMWGLRMLVEVSDLVGMIIANDDFAANLAPFISFIGLEAVVLTLGYLHLGKLSGASTRRTRGASDPEGLALK